MIYYLSVIALITILYIISCYLKFSKAKKVFLFLAFAILFLLSALRSEILGTDLERYVVRYYYYGNLEFSSFDFSVLSEFGFAIYCKIIYLLSSGNFRIFMIITSFFSLIGVYNFIRDNSNNYYLSILSYFCFGFYFFTFSGLKQSLAISLVMFSFSFVKKNNIKMFLIIVLLASTFHLSALIVLPAYFVSKFNFKPSYVPIYIMLILVFYIFRFTIVSLITSYIYSDYEVLSNSGGGYIFFFMLFVIFVYLTSLKKKLLLLNENNNAWYNFFAISLIFQILATVEGNAHRLTFYYLIPIVSLIPCMNSIIKKQDPKSKLLFNIILVVILIAYYVVTTNYKSYSFM